jgi:hypothetical protein
MQGPLGDLLRNLILIAVMTVASGFEEPNNEGAIVENALPKGKALPLAFMEWSGNGLGGEGARRQPGPRQAMNFVYTGHGSWLPWDFCTYVRCTPMQQ